MFDAIAGQEALRARFARQLAEGSVAHAYLLVGREGLGKTAFARELGAALVAPCGGCGGCPECERARRGLHPGVHIVEREGDVIRVEQVQPILADLALKPFGCGRRVWIAPEVETLHVAAANKLLKTIEEPPPDVHFLLISDHLERVLPTIVSRCQVVEFRPLSNADIAEHLRNVHSLPDLEVETMSRLAGGSIERAERLLADARGPNRRRTYLDVARTLVGGGREAESAAHDYIAVLADHQKEIKTAYQNDLQRRLVELESQFQEKRELKWRQEAATARQRRQEVRACRAAALDALDVLASWVRDLWVVTCGAREVLCNSDREAELCAAAVAGSDYYARLLAVLSQTRKELSLNIDQKLAFKALFAHFEEVAESA